MIFLDNLLWEKGIVIIIIFLFLFLPTPSVIMARDRIIAVRPSQSQSLKPEGVDCLLMAHRRG